MAIVYFAVLYFSTFLIVIIFLAGVSSYRPVYEDPFFGQYMAILLLISVILSMCKSIMEYRRSKTTKRKVDQSSTELMRLAADRNFVAVYASEGEEGETARARISELLEKTGGWPSETLRMVFERADNARRSRKADERNASLNKELRDYVLGSHFKGAFFSPDPSARSACEQKVGDILQELGDAVDAEIKSTLEDAYARRSFADEDERAKRKRIHNLKERLNLLVDEDNDQAALQHHDAAALGNNIAEAKQILEELGEAAGENAIKRISRMEDLYNLLEENARLENAREKGRLALERSRKKEKELRELRRLIEANLPTEDEVKREMTLLDSMDGWKFESYVAELLRSSGYKNVQVTSGSGDQGIDVIATKDGVEYGIQCKNYNSPVGNKAVQEAFAGKSYYRCHVAIVLTNSTFSPSAKELAEAIGVSLWDRGELQKLVRKYLSTR